MYRSLGLALLVVLSACRAEQAKQDLGGDPIDTENPDLLGAPSDVDLASPSTPNSDGAVVSGDHCEPLTPRADPVEVFALPEDGEPPYVDVLETATKSIRVTAYLMGYGGILDTLEAKCKAGLDVKIILDAGQTANDKYETLLKNAGCSVKRSDPSFTYYHAKIMVVDDVRAVVSTGNYSKTYSVERERNFVSHVDDPNDVADLKTIFDADWNGTPLQLACTRLLVSPINSKERILSLIASATTTLEVESMQMAETDIRAAIAERAKAGVAVRVLLAAPSWIDANQDAADYLQIQNIKPRYMSTPGVHVKAIVVDGERAYLGSQNMSWTSMTKNREVGLFIGGASEAAGVKRMLDTFDKDWATAKEFN